MHAIAKQHTHFRPPDAPDRSANIPPVSQCAADIPACPPPATGQTKASISSWFFSHLPHFPLFHLLLFLLPAPVATAIPLFPNTNPEEILKIIDTMERWETAHPNRHIRAGIQTQSDFQLIDILQLRDAQHTRTKWKIAQTVQQEHQFVFYASHDSTTNEFHVFFPNLKKTIQVLDPKEITRLRSTLDNNGSAGLRRLHSFSKEATVRKQQNIHILTLELDLEKLSKATQPPAAAASAQPAATAGTPQSPPPAPSRASQLKSSQFAFRVSSEGRIESLETKTNRILSTASLTYLTFDKKKIEEEMDAFPQFILPAATTSLRETRKHALAHFISTLP